ncbi:MAG: ATP-binding protein [Bacteroidota bacterium]
MPNYLKYLTYAILAYMVIAFGWWTILLNNTARDAHEAKMDRLAMRLVFEQKMQSTEDFVLHPVYAQLQDEYRRDKLQLLGETLLLAVTMLVGIYVVYRSVQNEVSSTQQQRNFLLSITHELKSPIAGIRLILETFQKRKSLPAGIQEKLSTNALKETDRLTTLVNDLLLSAKLETSYVLNKEPLHIEPIIEEVLEKVCRKYPGTKIHLDIEPDLPLVDADQTGITSVITNLIENAAKYSQPDPEIEVSLKQISKLEIMLSVADNGIGIPDHEKQQVLQKFYRVGSEDTRQTKGTGLGLYIVQQLVNRHGGVLTIKDNQPRGTSFRVSLPVQSS